MLLLLFIGSVVSNSVTTWTLAHQASLSITVSWSWLKLMSIDQWWHSTISSSAIPFSSCLQSFPVLGSFPMIQLFASGDQSIGASATASDLPEWIQNELSDWLSESTQIDYQNSIQKEYSGLISFRIDWFYFLALQGTLKSLLQHHSSKSSILWQSAFFIVQLSHPYMTTGKTIALTRWNLISKIMSLLLLLKEKKMSF